MDTAALKASWARLAAHGDAVPGFFYATLFTAHPHLRGMFPASMAAQRDRLVGALGRIVSGVDELDTVTSFVEGLGRDHRRFDVRPEHYPAVGDALLATLAHFLGDHWSPRLAADWTAAYELISRVMVDAAARAPGPPYWAATVIAHERRGLDVAVLRLRPDQPYPYQPGQSAAVEVPARPRLWRYYSPANAPRPDGHIDLHVKAVPGGQVSTAIAYGLQPGDVVKLGAPVGQRLTLDPASEANLLLIAGGTGLAPLRAIVEQVAADTRRRRVTLFVGARTHSDLYDQPALDAMARACPWLTVVPVLSDDPWHTGERAGPVAEVALRHGRWDDHDVYVCGSAAMVVASRQALRDAGIPVERIHSEDDTDDPYRPALATLQEAATR